MDIKQLLLICSEFNNLKFINNCSHHNKPFTMKLFSVQTLVSGALKVIKRFPFEVIFTLIGCIAATINIELSDINYTGESWCWRFIAGANLGVLLSLSVTLFSESQQLPLRQKWLLRLIAFLVVVLLMVWLNPYEHRSDTIRFFLLSFALHLLVAFAAFTQAGTIQGFWQFNKTIFLRFFTSVLYSGVLFAGLAAAIAAVNFLFGVDFRSDTYLVLWVWITGFFNTLFFLAGVPDQFSQLNHDDTYPKGLKVFTQYVLIPLATVYVLILLAYETKILLQWQLPKGSVSSLIIGYAIFGILSILLVYPIRQQDENKWIKTYAKSFYFLLLPLLVLFFVAVGVRVFKYGITEYRYFLIMLAFWLLAVSLYFLWSRKQNIKLIPMSLCLLAVLAVYGPQSAVGISSYSQRHILEDIFQRNQAYKNGLLLPVNSNKMSRKDGSRAVGIIEYLIKHDDLDALQPYFKHDLNKVSATLAQQKSRWRTRLKVTRSELQEHKTEWVKKQLHLQRFDSWGYDDTAVYVKTNTFYSLHSSDEDFIRISGYDYLLDAGNSVADTGGKTNTYYINRTKITEQTLSDSRYSIKIDTQKVVFDVKRWLITTAGDPRSLERYHKADHRNTYTLPAEKMTITRKVGKHEVTFKIKLLNYDVKDESPQKQISYIDGSYLIKW